MSDPVSVLALTEDWRHGGFGLYLHWPFCKSKCPYCDFNSHVAANIDQSRWTRAYLTEIDRVGKETQGRVLQSVFFGGGTPSLMEPAMIDTILRKVRDTWPAANDQEVTMEANPTSAEARRFAGYQRAGVNRVSVGVQALSDGDLRALGRTHSVAEAVAAFQLAQGIFDRVSFDLIYARQNQTLDQWQAELQQALDLAIDHLSLYQLTIEDGTAFGDRHAVGKLAGLPDDDRAADMYAMTREMTEAAGLIGYEVSNFARPGHESRHNQIYWRYGDYAGIGPGAHGRLTIGGQRFATICPKAPSEWLGRVERLTNGEDPREELRRSDQFSEALMMGLRLRHGVDLVRIEALGNVDLSNKIKSLSEIEMVEMSCGRLRATERGLPVLNAVLRALLAD